MSDLFAAVSGARATDVKRALRTADVNAVNGAGETPLLYLADCYLGDVGEYMAYAPKLYANAAVLVQLLVDAGADVNVKDAEGKTALDRFAGRTCEFVDAVRVLLAAKAHVTPATLIEAATMNNAVIAALLLERKRLDRGAALRAANRDRNAQVAALLSGRAMTIPDSARHVHATAVKLFEAGDYRGVVKAYAWVPKQIRELTPPIVSNLGYCMQQLKRHEEALAYFATAYRLDPSITHVLQGACFSAYALERWSAMLKWARLATRRLPKHAYSWQQLQIAQAELGRHRAALASAKHALAIDADNAYVLATLATSQRALKDPAWKATLRRAFELEPAFRRDASLKKLAKKL